MGAGIGGALCDILSWGPKFLAAPLRVRVRHVRVWEMRDCPTQTGHLVTLKAFTESVFCLALVTLG